MVGSRLVSRVLLLTAVHFVLDSLIVPLSMAVAASWRFEAWMPPQVFRYLPAVAFAMVILPSVIYTGGLYSPSRIRLDSWARIRWVFFGLGATLVVLLGIGSIHFDARVGRGVLGLAFPLLALLCAGHHLFLHRKLHSSKLRAVCLVSNPEDEIAVSILAGSSHQTEIVAVIPVAGYQPSSSLPRLGDLSTLASGHLPKDASTVLVTEQHLVIPSLTPILRRWRYQGIDIVSLADVCEMVFQAVPLPLVNESWLFRASSQSGLLYIKKLKRLFDICVSLLCLILLWPALLLGMLAVRLGSPGPVFFRQTRLGRLGREFTIVKLRTMHVDAEKDGPQWSRKQDDRVFALGVWLRRFRIDEIPQLINIFRGEMSFVGPRPERPEFIDALESSIPFYRERLLVQPGLTGWAQVRYPYGASLDDAWHKHELDLYYIKHMSLLLDFFILIETVRTVLTGGVRPSPSHLAAMRAWTALSPSSQSSPAAGLPPSALENALPVP